MNACVIRRSSFVVSVALALCSAVACGGGGSSSSPTSPGNGGGPTPTADVVITIQGMLGSNSFSPSNASVKVGQTVAWSNGAGEVAHAILGDAGGFNTGIIAGGTSSAPVTMNTAGTFPYHCSIHPSMTGTLTVQ